MHFNKRQCLVLPLLMTIAYFLLVTLHLAGFPLDLLRTEWRTPVYQHVRQENFHSPNATPALQVPVTTLLQVTASVNRTSLLATLERQVDYEGMTPDQIGEFQQSQVEKFCQAYETWEHKTPEKVADRQILVSDEAKTALCYVPKTGCTTLKVLLFMTLKAVPKSVLSNKSAHPYEGFLERAIQHHSFLGKTDAEKESILHDYYKFIMYRNPVERLVSAYVSKIQAYPMIGLELSEPERNWLKMEIYKATHPEEFNAWKEGGANISIPISFPDFIEYWIQTGGIRKDEHFTTIFELCSPCKMRYSYYGNFNSFNKEVRLFSERIGGNLSHLLEAEHQNAGPTLNTAPKFYRELTRHQKEKIVDILATDLLFYYSLFPMEIDSHKNIMRIDYDLIEMQ